MIMRKDAASWVIIKVRNMFGSMSEGDSSTVRMHCMYIFVNIEENDDNSVGIKKSKQNLVHMCYMVS